MFPAEVALSRGPIVLFQQDVPFLALKLSLYLYLRVFSASRRYRSDTLRAA
jgi:hypothetical protein